MADDGLTVRGGVGGISVAIGDLMAAAVVARRWADEVRDLNPPAPQGLAQEASAWWVRGDRLRVAGELELLGVGARSAGLAYASAEQAAARLSTWTATPIRTATHWLGETGPTIGLLRDGVGVTVREEGAAGVPAVPTTLAGLMQVEIELSDLGDGRIRIFQVPQPGGGVAWVVALPGTQVWSPAAGANPWDLTTDVDTADAQVTAAAAGVLAALAMARQAAGRGGAEGAHDPILLSGHSQGGMVGALVAGSAELAGHPVSLFTAGSPIAALAVPPRVQVLSLEHHEDLVPRVDGAENPDLPNLTTVTRHLPLRGDPIRQVVQAHEGGGYQQTAALVDRSAAAHSSIAAWLRAAQPGLRGSACGVVQVRDYVLERG